MLLKEVLDLFTLGLAKRDFRGLGAESWFVVCSKPCFCQNDIFIGLKTSLVSELHSKCIDLFS